VRDGFERELLPEDKVPTDRISIAMSFRMTMAPERLAEVRAGVEELVAMRNELVHHFIERFEPHRVSRRLTGLSQTRWV
jgi:hypothetical protein